MGRECVGDGIFNGKLPFVGRVSAYISRYRKIYHLLDCQYYPGILMFPSVS